MNYIKAQKEIVTEILKGGRCGRFSIDENSVLVSPNGCMAYIIPLSSIVFNLEKTKEITAFPVREIVKSENELTLTQDIRLEAGFQKRMFRRLKGKGKNVFVNVKFLECFQNPKFYQEENKLSIIVVTERTSSKDELGMPVGIILPVRSTWDDGTYYNDMEGENDDKT